MQALAESLRVGFAMSGKDALGAGVAANCGRNGSFGQFIGHSIKLMFFTIKRYGNMLLKRQEIAI